jgi:polyisoprenoid-binding protein YceI
MKVALGIIVVIILGVISFVVWSPENAPTGNTDARSVATEKDTVTTERSVVTEGEYVVQEEESTVNWAGKKPFVDGYVNSGSIGVKEGSVSVGEDTVSAIFTIDMNTLSVSNTPTKPGRESALEGHLKGEGWFDVEQFSEATFEILSVTPRADSETTFVYDIEGDLTMKGVTDTLQFPATIYQEADGRLYASANFEFDRTKWGITSGSGSFFDNLADNVIDDMVALSFELVAEKQ